MTDIKKPRTARRRPVKIAGTPPTVRRAAEELAELTRQEKALKEAISAAKSVLMDYMEDSGNDNLDFEFGKFSRIQAETVVTDPDKLKKIIGAPTYNKITTSILDKNKLDAFIKSGEIDSKSVAAASEIKKNNPYVKTALK